MNKRLGSRTLRFGAPPSLLSWASVAGEMEDRGRLRGRFDLVYEDVSLKEKSWEKAECRMQQDALALAAKKAGFEKTRLDALFAGDLINQCIISSFGAAALGVPFLGVFGACSTMAESLGLAGVFIDGGFGQYAGAVTSSHFCTAERQFRMPVEYGGQRPPSAQWTVTGSGAVLLGAHQKPPYLTHACFGTIVDAGITDANNMGAAMAPSAFETLRGFFSDTKTTPADYDCIVTGDLGTIGSQILRDLFQEEGVTLGERYWDCGASYFTPEQDTHSGGSGCGCAATTLCAQLLPELADGRYRNLLFAATGALMNPTSVQQGENIPGICHLLCFSR